MLRSWGGVHCAPHCSELSGRFFAAAPDTATPQGELAAAMASYLASFAQHADPNPGRRSGSPEWPRFNATAGGGGGGGGGGANLLFALPAAGGVRAEWGYRRAACDYWQTLPNGPDGRVERGLG